MLKINILRSTYYTYKLLSSEKCSVHYLKRYKVFFIIIKSGLEDERDDVRKIEPVEWRSFTRFSCTRLVFFNSNEFVLIHHQKMVGEFSKIIALM